MEKFDSNRLLPTNIIYKSAANQLYRIGLTIETYLFQFDSQRQWFNKPILLMIANIIFLMNRIICLFANKQNKLIFIVLGDFGYLLGIGTVNNIFFILITLLVINTQLIYYYNYKNGVKPTFLRVFQMISGLIPPRSVGLTNQWEVMKLVRPIRLLFRFTKFNNNFMILNCAFCVNILSYAIYTSIHELLMFGIPNAIFFTIWGYYYWQLLLYPIIYLYIICLYFKLKLRAIYRRINWLKKRPQEISHIRDILLSFNRINNEIYEYNQTFWSKYLLCFWVSFGSATVLMLFNTLFGSMDILVKIIYIYVLIIFLQLFLFVIFTASAVNSEANKSYGLMNEVMVLNVRYIRMRDKIMVFTLFAIVIKSHNHNECNCITVDVNHRKYI